METPQKNKLHPLLTAAAISVTVFSAVGVGAMTGLLPHSFGSTKDAAPSTQLSQAPSSAPAPAAAPAPLPDAANMPPASAASTPEPSPAPVHKPAKKHVVAHKAAPAPVANADFGTPPPPPPPTTIAQAPAPAPVVEAPKPVPGVLGVVESVREVKTPAKESNGVGPIAGGIAGAVLGNQVGHGNGRTIATVLGAAAGAFGGKEIEKQVRSTSHWEVTVRLDDGSRQTITSPTAPFWHGGERVRYLDGRITPA
ncbi:MAG: glycine zipper 2TM domain-containing protein [Clostridia bacterium]